MSEMRVAVVTEVFHQPDGPDRLQERLIEARRAGADLVVLPELPLNPWSPVGKEARDEDAEPRHGARALILKNAARGCGIALLGGVIERDPSTGRRHNCALLFSAEGSELGRYRKTHLPEEEGYWETSHFEPGDDLAEVVRGLAMPVGVQLCSDNKRPMGTHLLAAAGAEVILAPRATPTETYERWRLVLRANAVTSCSYVISANRPGPVPGVDMGGPSMVIAPDGELLVASTERLEVVTLSSAVVAHWRREYPGYLPIRSDMYARGWQALADTAADLSD